MFLKNTRKVIKTLPEEGYEFVLYLSDAKECRDISAGTVAHSDIIVAFGECKTMDIKTAEAVLPNPKFLHNIVSGRMEDTYHCFCCENLGVEQFVGHKTALHSWTCLMHSLGDPSHCVITQETIKKT